MLTGQTYSSIRNTLAQKELAVYISSNILDFPPLKSNDEESSIKKQINNLNFLQITAKCCDAKLPYPIFISYPRLRSCYKTMCTLECPCCNTKRAISIDMLDKIAVEKALGVAPEPPKELAEAPAKKAENFISIDWEESFNSPEPDYTEFT